MSNAVNESSTSPLEQEIMKALNRHSAEAPSNTPDYILAAYLTDCLKAFNRAMAVRNQWYGINELARAIEVDSNGMD